jgi:hypothetical protein
MIRVFGQIYAIESEIRGRSAAERAATRQVKTAPIMAELKRRLEDQLPGLSSKSKLAGAWRTGRGPDPFPERWPARAGQQHRPGAPQFSLRRRALRQSRAESHQSAS